MNGVKELSTDSITLQSSSLTKEGFKFCFYPSKCEQCGGKCCVGESGYVFVNVDEMLAMAKFLGLAFEVFTQKFVRKVGYKFSLIETPRELSNDFCCNILECVSIVINRRYGSNTTMINTVEDMNDYLFDSNTSKETRSNACIQRFMNDKEWYYNQTINGKEKELLNSIDDMEEYSYGDMGK